MSLEPVTKNNQCNDGSRIDASRLYKFTIDSDIDLILSDIDIDTDIV